MIGIFFGVLGVFIIALGMSLEDNINPENQKKVRRGFMLFGFLLSLFG